MQVNVGSTTGLVIGQSVSNANLPSGTYIRRVISGTTIELNAMSTNTADQNSPKIVPDEKRRNGPGNVPVDFRPVGTAPPTSVRTLPLKQEWDFSHGGAEARRIKQSIDLVMEKVSSLE